ncbi:hypothetical protein [Leuconostoc citreum]|uniref:hypothetical protein n=1 Tax=Leuconostoc citreum TaxID=33964 RepID=UPI0032DE9BE3
MSVKVTFVDNHTINIADDAQINAWNSSETTVANHEFHSNTVFSGSLQDNRVFGKADSATALRALLGSADWFSLKGEPKKVYKTSAILSLETV